MSRVWTVKTIKYDWEAIQVCHGFIHRMCERLICYSSFMNASYVAWTVESSMKWGKRGLDDEENVTGVKEKETIMKKDKQGSVVNLCNHLHILVMALHIDWVGEEWMIEIDMQSSKKGQGRESIQSRLIILLLYSVEAIVVIYPMAHMYMYTDYTKYINTCNDGQVRPYDACSICLVLHM